MVGGPGVGRAEVGWVGLWGWLGWVWGWLGWVWGWLGWGLGLVGLGLAVGVGLGLGWAGMVLLGVLWCGLVGCSGLIGLVGFGLDGWWWGFGVVNDVFWFGGWWGQLACIL